jgi:hypothetical protein
MAHAIEVHLSANVEKFNQGMAAAKKTSTESVGFIASIFNTVKSYFAGMWDSVKSFFSNMGEKGASAWESFKSSASGALEKVLAMLPGVGKAAKDVGDEAEGANKKTDSWLSKIAAGLTAVIALAAVAAIAIGTLAAKGLLIDSAFAKISVSTNVGAGSLSKFADAAKRSGMTVDQLGAGITTFQAAMKEAAAGTGAKVFSDLGVNVKNSKDELLATAPTLVDFAKKVAAMSSEAEKYEAAAKSGFKVQFLEDIARASTLAAGTTDEQAAAVVRLGKIFHEILPSGKGMWDDISTSLSNKLTPALTTAAVAILESKNKIVDAFNRIYGGGSLFDKLTDKIKGWADGMAGYFANVVKSATGAAISVAAYIAKATGLGGDLKTAPSGGIVPAVTPLTSGKPVVVATKADEDAAKKYDEWTKSVLTLAEAQKLELQQGTALTQGQRMQLTLLGELKDGTAKETDAQVVSRKALIDKVIANEKQIASVRLAQQDADALAKKQAQNYATITAAIEAKIAQNELEILYGAALTEGQKLAIKIEKEMEAGKRSLTAAQIAETKARQDRLAVSEKDLALSKAQIEVDKYIAAGAIAREESTAALKAEASAYGKSADEREILMVAVKAEADMQKEIQRLKEARTPADEAQLERLAKERDLRAQVGQAAMGQSKAWTYAQQLADANKLYAAQSISDPQASAAAVLQIDTDIWQQRIKLAGDGTAAQKALQTEYNTWLARATKDSIGGANLEQARQLLDIMYALDDSAQSAASGMAASFGQVGTAIGGLTTALTGYGRTQAAIAAQLAQSTLDAKGDTSKVSRANALAAQQSAQAQIHSYGDMAGAAKGFFKQNSAGYKAMEAVEKGFRAYEMAMAVEAMVKKIFFKETEVAANVGLNATKIAGEAAASAASTGLAATESSAWGITAVVKALASLPFPANLAAGAATLAAVVAIGAQMLGGIGGGSVSVSEQRQTANGTGTVFGDSSAKSDSIARSIALSAANSNIELTHTAGMLMALRNIESSIGGLSNVLIRSSGLTGAMQSDSLGAAASFASSTVGTLITGGPIGLVLDKLLGGKISSLVGKVVNSIFGGNTTSLDTGLTAMSASLGAVLKSGVTSSQYNDTKTDGGWFSSDKYRTQTTSLGAAADQQLTAVITNMAASIGEAGKLLGLGGDAFTARLNSFVVDIGKISLKGMSGEDIQKALEAAFSKVGDDMAKFAVGGLDSFAKVGEGYLETLTRIATDYANVDSILQGIGKTFGAVGLGSIAARENLINLAGGIDALASQASGFASNFLSQAEQLAPVQKYVTDQLAAMGLSGIQTREDFKAVVMSLDLTNPAAQQMYASLMSLQEAFAKTHAATVDLTKSESELADERADLQKQYDQLTMTSTQLRAKERLAIGASNLALFDQITNLQTIASTSDALKTSIDKLKTFKDGILSFRDSLTLGSLSTLNPMQKAAEAQRQYEDMLAKAKAGDATAQAGIQGAATAYLTADQIIKASSDAYVNDAMKVQADLMALADSAGAQISVDQLQLTALDNQVSQLATLNTTVEGLREDNAKLREDHAALLAAVQEQTSVLGTVILQAGAQNADDVNKGAMNAGPARNYKQMLQDEATPQ